MTKQERDRAYYQKNRERVLARVKKRAIEKAPEIAVYKRQHRIKNIDHIKAREKIVKEANRDRYLKSRKDRYQRDRDILISRQREYNLKNPEKVAISRRNTQAKRRAKCKDTDIDIDFLIELKGNTKICELCNESLVNKKVHLDHIIPLNVGGLHSRNNVRYICSTCNQRRPRDGRDLVNTDKIT